MMGIFIKASRGLAERQHESGQLFVGNYPCQTECPKCGIA
jgi:hypothetical protein